jgi:signal transduction histidine kinase
VSDRANPRVLLVDDERDFLDSLSQRLRLRDLPVFTATSGPEALEVLDRENVDVVVLDVRMPGMDGIETLRRIKECHPRVEVVMLTGHADLSSSLEGMRFGFFDYLTKPVAIGELIDKIGDAYRRRLGEPVAEGETFRDKLKEHMIVADRLASLGELAASIAHEINNPLAVISEAAGWLRARASRPGTTPGELADAVDLALDRIERAVDRASRTSQNFLRFARAPGTMAREVDLGDLADEVVELTAKTAEDGSVDVDVIAPDGAGRSIVTDPYQLRQVLLNVVTNAIQAVDRHGRIVIRIDGGPDTAAISVIDNGPGIPPEYLERIFEPFFTTKADSEGTGLGLAVSRGIVEKLGGRIEVDNRPGEGCTFRIVLPRRRP